MYKIYKFNSGSIINLRRESDGANIPFAEDNTDYQAYLAWVAEGNTAEEWQPE
jgi:hypothetical protein